MFIRERLASYCAVQEAKCDETVAIAKCNQPLHCSGTDMELQSLGREMASVRLMGRLKGTFPVRMRQAQSAPVRTISASEPQHCCVGDPPPLVLPVTKLRHGVNVVISDTVHDVATCPDAGAAASSSSAATTAAAASIL